MSTDLHTIFHDPDWREMILSPAIGAAMGWFLAWLTSDKEKVVSFSPRIFTNTGTISINQMGNEHTKRRTSEPSLFVLLFCVMFLIYLYARGSDEVITWCQRATLCAFGFNVFGCFMLLTQRRINPRSCVFRLISSSVLLVLCYVALTNSRENEISGLSAIAVQDGVFKLILRDLNHAQLTLVVCQAFGLAAAVLTMSLTSLGLIHQFCSANANQSGAAPVWQQFASLTRPFSGTGVFIFVACSIVVALGCTSNKFLPFFPT